MRNDVSAARERPLAITILGVIAIILGSYDLFFEAFLLFRPETPFIQSTVAWYARVADTTYLHPNAETLAFTTMNVFWGEPIMILTGIGLLRMRRWGFAVGIAEFVLCNYANTYDFLVDYWDGFSRLKSIWIVLGVGMIQFSVFSFFLLYYLVKYADLFYTPRPSDSVIGSRAHG